MRSPQEISHIASQHRLLFCMGSASSMEGTITFGIHYAASNVLNLLGFTDSDWVGDSIDHKSTSRYSLSVRSSPFRWSSKKQAAISLSSAEAKYRGVVNITIQALWLQQFLTELGVQFHQPIVIWCENQSTLKFCRDLVQRQQMKHIDPYALHQRLST
eukprot:PITA_13354